MSNNDRQCDIASAAMMHLYTCTCSKNTCTVPPDLFLHEFAFAGVQIVVFLFLFLMAVGPWMP